MQQDRASAHVHPPYRRYRDGRIGSADTCGVMSPVIPRTREKRRWCGNAEAARAVAETAKPAVMPGAWRRDGTAWKRDVIRC